MSYCVSYSQAAEREFKKLPRTAQSRIAAQIVLLATDPRPPGCRKMRGTTDDWRIRVGNYRVVYTIDDTAQTVTLHKVGDRRDVYED